MTSSTQPQPTPDYEPRVIEMAAELADQYANSAISIARERKAGAVFDRDAYAFWLQVVTLLEQQL